MLIDPIDTFVPQKGLRNFFFACVLNQWKSHTLSFPLIFVITTYDENIFNIPSDSNLPLTDLWLDPTLRLLPLTQMGVGQSPSFTGNDDQCTSVTGF